MRQSTKLWPFLFLGLAVCSGRGRGGGGDDDDSVGDGDADADSDSDADGDADDCSSVWRSGGGGGSSCNEALSWRCGDTHYSVECTCPEDLCTCLQDGSAFDTFIPDGDYCADPDNCSDAIPIARCPFQLP